MKKRKPKGDRESKAKPEIYVAITQGSRWRRTLYARAHIRVKAGGYQYLQWRDGEKIKTLYLGMKRES